MPTDRRPEPADTGHDVRPPTEETEEVAAVAREHVEPIEKGPGAPMQHGENT